jgi:hypothetical protein
MSNRNLATVQTIASLEPIKDKDRILYASFKNVSFRVIVSADTKVDDKVIYCEVDSLLPVRPEFEFLRARCYSEKWNGFRIRNMKMCNLYSEGLVLPISLCPEAHKLADGADVTEALGIIKYDPESLEEASATKVEPKPLSAFRRFIYRFPLLTKLYNKLFFQKKESYSWPKWASKSDETRAQNLPYIYDQYQGQTWLATEKLDGQSCLFALQKQIGLFRPKYKLTVCSRNLNLKEGTVNNYWTFAKSNDIKSKLIALHKKLNYDFYIQGELCGPGIQSNKYAFPSRCYFIFNMRNIKTGQYLPYSEMKTLCQSVGLDVVPHLETFTWTFKSMPELLKYADGFSLFGDKVLREGVVLRPLDVRPPDRGQANMTSFKVISPSFDIRWSQK